MTSQTAPKPLPAKTLAALVAAAENPTAPIPVRSSAQGMRLRADGLAETGPTGHMVISARGLEYVRSL